MKTTILLLAFASLAGIAHAQPQIEAGCTPIVPALVMQQALSVNGLFEGNCYALNKGNATGTLSVVGFALDFLEIEQLSQAQVIDLFTQKVAESGWARAGRYAGYVGLAGLVVTGQGYIAVTGKIASSVGIATYGATQLQKYAVTQEPSVSSAIAGMLTADVPLAPGQGVTWKVFASNTVSTPVPGTALRTVAASTLRVKKGVRVIGSIGPKILTNVGTPAPHAELKGDEPVTAVVSTCPAAVSDPQVAAASYEGIPWMREASMGLD